VLRHRAIPEIIKLDRGVFLSQYLIMKPVQYVAFANPSVQKLALLLWMNGILQILDSAKDVGCVPMNAQLLQLQ